MTTNGEDSTALHLQLKSAVGPNIGYLCTVMEIGVLKAFIDWKVFDHIPDEGQISASSLAEKIGGEKELLDRTLPLLTTLGILAAPETDHVAHTDRSRLYKSDQIGAGFLTHMHNLFVRSISHFPAYLALHGFSSPMNSKVTPFGLATGFDSFVGRTSKVFPMTGVYDLSWVKQLPGATSKEGRPLFVDIGGSNGHALRDILQDHPWLCAERCAVFDRAPTIEATRANLDDKIKSIRLVAGSVLDTVPPPAQGSLIYQFRRILNDFADDDVRRCWKTLRTVAAPDTRVNVVEELLQANRNTYAIAQDLSFMMVGGKRRNAQMHAELAAEAGFKLNRTFPDTYNDCSVLEFVLA
ncbi:hypothetical protein GQ44DRAFT_738836 [Phaeosphaeriaceae sp. PMI808]|nr:hypothetical protein GQ44DRAFT_738836 [Phaeosphaeriaceae sp. PMI808]